MENYNKFDNSFLNRVYWCCELDQARIPQLSLDLIVLSHTLHHIDKALQNEILDQLVLLLKPKGLLYVLEDSWSAEKTFYTNVEPEFDAVFKHLSIKEKKKIFELNEFWANSWFYRRKFDLQNCTYRNVEDWITLLESKNLSILDYGSIGFDSRRLHGVPSAWAITRKN